MPSSRTSPKRTRTSRPPSRRPPAGGRERGALSGAGLPLRLAAGLIDGVLTAAIMVGLALAANALGGPAVGLRYVAAVMPLLYFVIPEVYYQATPGKLITGLRVVTLEGGRPDLLAHLVRGMTRVPEALVVVPYLFVVPFSRLHQRLGDMITETLVVKRDGAARAG